MSHLDRPKALKKIKDIELSGLSVSSASKHYSILPIFFFSGVASVMAAAMLFRNFFLAPETAPTHRVDPWESYRNKQYKFLSSGRDYSKASPAPKYKA